MSSSDDPGAGGPRPGPPAAGADLDGLAADLRARARDARAYPERLGALLDAVVAVSRNLDLPVVLAHIVESACHLLDARYGALGVVDAPGARLVEFVTDGVTPERRETIGASPAGHGVLGLLLHEPRPLRIDDLATHPLAVGFPEGHPPMHSFIGAPVRVRDHVFGNLYLTNKAGGGPFTDDDEALLEALAAAAGIAVENAQLYRRARNAERWARAIGDLTQTLLEGRHERAAFARMVKRARDLGNAQLCALLVRDGDGLVIQAVDSRTGRDADILGTVVHDRRFDLMLRARTRLLLLTQPEDTHPDALADRLRRAVGLPRAGTTAIVPVTVGEVELGLVAMSWGPDVPPDIGETMDLLGAFVEQMALAVEATRAQHQRARAALLEDRDRIARDMHDHVIQRLFAAGLSLQAAARLAGPALRERLDGAVDEIDQAVKDIRSAIFELHHGFGPGGLGPEIEAVVEAAAAAVGFVPDVTFEGLLAAIPPDLEADVVAVVREGLANVARHAQATDAQVSVATLDDLVVIVRDDGVGVAGRAPRSGLANLDRRARRHGGTSTVTSLVPAGTELRWVVPLPGRLGEGGAPG